MNRRAAVAIFFFALVSALPAVHAATFVVPPDSEMVQKSMAVVDGTVVEVYARYSPDGHIQTVNRVAVRETMKGPIQQFNVIDVVQLGGVMGDFQLISDASPTFSTGDEVILFLEKDKYGDWTSWQNALGAFRQENDRLGRKVVMRASGDVSGWDEQGNSHVEMTRLSDSFKEFIRGVAGGASPVEDYFLSFSAAPELHTDSTGIPHVEFTGYDYVTLGSGGQKIRRTDVSRAWHVCTLAGAGAGNGGCGGGSEGGFDIRTFISTGTAAWDNEPSSTVNYSKGTDSSSTAWQCGGHGGGGNFSESNLVLPNDPLQDIPGSFTGSGEIAQAEFGFGSGTNVNPADGLTYETIICGDILIQDGITSGFGTQAMNTAITHELGHTLGFRHSDRSPDNSTTCPGTSDCSSDAIMNSFVINGCCGASGATLQAWDISAVQNVYGSGAVCTPPSITTQPASKQISVGASTTLTVVAAGSPTLHFQWYQGTSPDKTNLIAGATSSTLNTGVLNTTTSFWVEVTGACTPVADSNTAVVTVCDTPTITTQPASQTVTSGATPTLSVTATGATSFQWFSGTSGNTSSPIGGATMSTFTTSPITMTSSFWVEVTNSCGTTNSNTATLTICVPPSITTQPANKMISAGNSTSLSVVAGGTGGFTYQWFIGMSGDTSMPISPNGTSSSVTVTPSSSTSYWVQVTGQCGSPIDSNTATVTVTPVCLVPVITSQSQSETVSSGDTPTLSVTATGATSFQWFQGNSGNTSDPMAGATMSTFTVPPVTGSISYWVQVTNSCGSANSTTINLGTCTPPTFTRQPSDQTILSGTSTSISFASSGTAPIGIVWFKGVEPDKSNPAGSNSNPLNTGTLTATTSYWVQLTNACGLINSRTVTITVTSSCTPPAITSEPANTSVQPGSSAVLSVTATGTSLSYQWFQGSVGDMSNPVGTNSSIFTTPDLNTTTSYWVKVTNACGTVNSTGATVTVTTTCVPVSITSEPASQSVGQNGFATLSVTTAGSTPINYQWFQGTVGNRSLPVGTNSQVLSVGPLSATTSYWVEATNACGLADSTGAIVTVSGCQAPLITTQPKSTSTKPGLHVSLQVVATGAAVLNYQWFQGSSGNTANPVGVNAPIFTTPAQTTSKSYWVRVTNGCGHADSATAVVSIGRRHAVDRGR